MSEASRQLDLPHCIVTNGDWMALVPSDLCPLFLGVEPGHRCSRAGRPGNAPALPLRLDQRPSRIGPASRALLSLALPVFVAGQAPDEALDRHGQLDPQSLGP